MADLTNDGNSNTELGKSYFKVRRDNTRETAKAYLGWANKGDDD